MTNMTAVTAQRMSEIAPQTHRPTPPDGLGKITVASLTTGLVSALVLTLVAFPGAREAVITGAGLVGLAIGWALLFGLSRWRTHRGQTWAAVPAIAMAVAGLLLLVTTPDDAALNTAGWIWAPVMLGVAVWSAFRARRSLDSRVRGWLVLPTLAALALASVGGGYQTVRATMDSAAYPMPGRSVEVGDHALHLDCSGTGSPTVVLESGLGGSSTLWSRVASGIGATTRVCAYDRAGQGWSDDTDTARDSLTIAADLRALLDNAGESGPYVLVGHSVGGAYVMTFAAQYPTAVAGMVLLDATSPYGADPAHATVAGAMGGASGPLALLPSVARMGLARPMPASTWSDLPEPSASVYGAYASSPRAMTNAVDEVSQYAASFAQAQALTSLGARPLVVLTLADKAGPDSDGWAAQERFADLSTNSSLRMADTTHIGLLDQVDGASSSVRAIVDVVEAVRAGTQVS